MLTPDEIGRRIRQARSDTGLSLRDAAERACIPVDDYQRLEEGSLSPLLGDYILLVAAALRVDFRYFISKELDEEEEQTREIYRAIGESTTDDRLAIRRFLRFCTAEHELEELLGVERSSLPPSRVASRGLYKDQGAVAAQDERVRLGLGNAPITNIFQVLRQQGVRLFRLILSDSNVSGLTIVHPIAGACVLVNYDEDLYRQFFSAAHEFAHVLFDRQHVEANGCMVSRKYTHKDLVEIRANVFASKFLLPKSAFDRYRLPREPSDLVKTIEQIARDYRVNTIVVAIALKDAGRITERTLNSFKRARPVSIPGADKLDPDIPGGLTKRQIERRRDVAKQGLSGYFLELLRRAVVDNEISFARFAEIVDMSVVQAKRFVKEVNLGL